MALFHIQSDAVPLVQITSESSGLKYPDGTRELSNNLHVDEGV